MAVCGAKWCVRLAHLNYPRSQSEGVGRIRDGGAGVVVRWGQGRGGGGALGRRTGPAHASTRLDLATYLASKINPEEKFISLKY